MISSPIESIESNQCARARPPMENVGSHFLGKLSDDWEINSHTDFSELLVDHKSKDSHLGGASIVELDGTLGELGLGIKGVPSEVDESVTEVTNEFIAGSFNVLHEGKFQKSNEEEHLGETSSRDGIWSDKGGNTVRVGLEGVTRHVNVSWKVDTTTGGDLSEESKLTDTSVLDLDVTETVELFLVTIGDKSQRIEESKRGLGTKLVLKGVEGRSLGGRLGWSESNSGGEEGGDDDRFHCRLFI
mmetsp:Transcript_2474/g.3911  ORF Transcript_2474/g.3911 Transcript_2474/m.3911 type:complete len:244 (-) Transcript_2474:34-765(-)